MVTALDGELPKSNFIEDHVAVQINFQNPQKQDPR